MFLAALAAARANNLSWPDSVRLAKAGAGLEVEIFGIQPIPLERLHHAILEQSSKTTGKLRTLDQLLIEVRARRAAGQRIIFTNGCFDILHLGHITLLERAAAAGQASSPHASCRVPDACLPSNPRPPGTADAPVQPASPEFLIVALNSDDSVRRLNKGPGRPINTEQDRARVLGALAHVGAVVLFNDDTPIKLIEAIKPDILVKGADYRKDQVVGGDYVEQHGGRVVLIDLVEGKSTTGTIAKMRRN
jgi:D-beta-D-heptose 7-phosphate kinase/D-beta-D-heptose 1-phosphate adenosyltransferase